MIISCQLSVKIILGEDIMQLNQYTYNNTNGWNKILDNSLDSNNTLVLIFASPDISFVIQPINELIDIFPNSKFMGCSTAGEIIGNSISKDRFVVQIIKFEKSRLELAHIKITNSSKSQDIGKQLIDKIDKKDLKYIFILGTSLHINGSQFTAGISSIDLKDVVITGGFAGDDQLFENTWVLIDKKPSYDFVSALGIYGEELYIGYGAKDGCNQLGIRREVTHSYENILYTLDNQSALELYKYYLGKRANGLPGTGLIFPLGVYIDGKIKIRTLIGINEKEDYLIFTGDISEGSTVTLLKSNLDSLIQSAKDASKRIKFDNKISTPLLCISVSCIGRKEILGQRIEDEIEAIIDELPKDTEQIGFYSYGEISLNSLGKCDLYNHTMSLTLIGEY